MTVKVDADVLAAMELQAMSLEVPETPGHPNKRPFSGILTRIDKPSDGPPGGSGGRRVIVTKACIEAAIPSLLGMAVDCNADFTDHAESHKIGMITEANIEGDALMIKGHFFAKDFPAEMKAIDKKKKLLGFSYELTPTNAAITADNMLKVEAGIFTGAALLYKSKAAYQTTSLAAATSKENEMELKELIAAVEALTASQKTITDSLAALATKVNAPPAPLQASLECRNMVEPHASALESAANAMQTAGVGAHPANGHVKVLHSMAASMRASAAMGQVPYIFRDHDYPFRASMETPDPALKAANDEIKASVAALTDSLKKVTDGLASITTQITDLKAAARPAAPERKTISAQLSQLLAKHKITPPEDGDPSKIDLTALTAALVEQGVSPEDRMIIKNRVARAASGLDA